MRYPGGKNGAGVWQRIVNQIPPHTVYVEPFGGSAAVLRRKRRASRSMVFDVDPVAVAALREWGLPPGTRVFERDGLAWLERAEVDSRWFVYCDPPYMLETRTKKRIYARELSEQEHGRLLESLLCLECMIAISGYPSGLYEDLLDGWRVIEYDAMTRGGVRRECLWMNYPEPRELHDYRWLGENFRERERFHRQQKRMVRKLQGMDRLQRLALAAAIAEYDEGAWPAA